MSTTSTPGSDTADRDIQSASCAHISAMANTSECQLQALAANLPGIIYQLIQFPDGSRAFPYVSSGCRELWELEPEAIQQDVRLVWNRIHPDDLPELEAAIADSAEQLSIYSAEYRLITPSGIKWFQATSRPQRLRDGGILWNGMLLDISDRKAAEQALQHREARKSEERFQHLAAAVPGAIFEFILQPDGTNYFSYISPTGCRALYEQEPEQVLYDTVRAFAAVHPDDAQKASDVMLTSARTLQIARTQIRHFTPSGQLKWVDTSAQPQRQPDGSVVWNGLMIDSTEHKRIEAEVQQQSQRSQLLAELTLKIRQVLQIQDILQTTVTEVRQLLHSDGVMVYQFNQNGSGLIRTESVCKGCPSLAGRNSNFALIPPHYWQMLSFGASQEQIFRLEDSDRSDLNPELIELIQNAGFKAMLVVPIMQQQTLWGLLIVHQFDSPRQWSQFEVELLKQLADQVSIALAQAQLLDALQVSEAKYRNLVEQTNDIVWEVDRNLTFIYVNPQARKILGYEAAAILGKTPLELKSAATRRFGILTKRYTAQPRSCTNVETALRHQAGHEVILESSGAPIFDQAGVLQGYRGMSRDITKRKQVETGILEALVKERELQRISA